MDFSFFQKRTHLVEIFTACESQEAKYQKIIELGRAQPPIDSQYKIPENIVRGCQSTVYLCSYTNNKKIFFQAESDALISSGLAALLLFVYSGESAEVILKHPPSYLEEMGITQNLTPSRANGMYSIHLRMKQKALQHLVEEQKLISL